MSTVNNANTATKPPERTKEDNRIAWSWRRMACLPIDDEKVASDGTELVETVGEAKKSMGDLLRANANLMAKAVKKQVPDLTETELAEGILNGYLNQLEMTGCVIMPDPMGMVKVSIRKDED